MAYVFKREWSADAHFDWKTWGLACVFAYDEGFIMDFQLGPLYGWVQYGW